jgi:hypothetical protein
MQTVSHEIMLLYVICLTVICADGSYHKFMRNIKGEGSRVVYAKFLEMTDDKM